MRPQGHAPRPVAVTMFVSRCRLPSLSLSWGRARGGAVFVCCSLLDSCAASWAVWRAASFLCYRPAQVSISRSLSTRALPHVPLSPLKSSASWRGPVLTRGVSRMMGGNFSSQLRMPLLGFMLAVQDGGERIVGGTWWRSMPSPLSVHANTQRGMGGRGRETEDDDTRERHTDTQTHKTQLYSTLSRHSASWAATHPDRVSVRHYVTQGRHVPPVAPPPSTRAPKVPRARTTAQQHRQATGGHV